MAETMNNGELTYKHYLGYNSKTHHKILYTHSSTYSCRTMLVDIDNETFTAYTSTSGNNSKYVLTFYKPYFLAITTAYGGLAFAISFKNNEVEHIQSGQLAATAGSSTIVNCNGYRAAWVNCGGFTSYYNCSNVYYADLIQGTLTKIRGYGYDTWCTASLSGKDISIKSNANSFAYYYGVLGIK